MNPRRLHGAYVDRLPGGVTICLRCRRPVTEQGGVCIPASQDVLVAHARRDIAEARAATVLPPLP